MRSKLWMALALCSVTLCHASTTDQPIELANTRVAVVKGVGAVTPPLNEVDRQYANRAPPGATSPTSTPTADKSVPKANTARLMLFGLGLMCVVAVRKNKKY